MEALITDNQTFNYIIVLLLFALFMSVGKVIYTLEIDNRQTLKELKKIQDENKQ